MSDDFEIGAGSSGDGGVIIEAVCLAGALDRAEHPTPDCTIFIWKANASEQIEAALHDLGYKLERRPAPQSTE